MVNNEEIKKTLNKLGYAKCTVETKYISWHTNMYIKLEDFSFPMKIEIMPSGCGVMQIAQYQYLTINENLEKAFKYLFSLNKACYVTTLGTEIRNGTIINEKWQTFFEKLGFVKLIEYPNLQHGICSEGSSDKQALYFLNCAT